METLKSYFDAIGFSELNPILQVIIIILLSYTSEDATTAVSTLMEQAGTISTSVYVAGIGLGLFTGDLLLYFLGVYIYKRYKQGKAKDKNKLLFGINPEEYQTEDSSTLTKRFFLILFSRFVPGTRFPAYIGAGITKFPLKYFILSKFIAIPIWISIFYFFGKVFAEALKANALYAVLLALGIYVLYRFAKSIYKADIDIPFKLRLKMLYYSLTKYKYYEFWPGLIFYVPSIIFCAVQVVRHRFRLWVPSAVNPAIKYGGVIMEPKSECCALVKDKAASLKQVLLVKNTSVNEAMAAIKKLGYPVILKPEYGHRGAAVKLINSDKEAKTYLTGAKYDVVAQEYCDYGHETGIFYIKNPARASKGQPLTQLFSFTHKVFPSVVGDGKETLAELILNDKRARYIASKYMQRFKESLSSVPKKGEEVQLVKSGSHTQGCKFEDGMGFTYSKVLHKRFDKIVDEMGEFYFGRFDVRYKDLKSLKEGKNFKIVEVNGATAEATHIFDDDLTIWQAFGVLWQQTAHLYEIADYNVRNGVKSISLLYFLKRWWQFLRTYSKYQPGS